MKTCPTCQSIYPDESESCPRDGSPLAPGFRDERECPFCAELILKKARVCKHCGRDVERLKALKEIEVCASCVFEMSREAELTKPYLGS